MRLLDIAPLKHLKNLIPINNTYIIIITISINIINYN